MEYSSFDSYVLNSLIRKKAFQYYWLNFRESAFEDLLDTWKGNLDLSYHSVKINLINAVMVRYAIAFVK